MPLLGHCLTIIRDKQTGKNLGYGFVRMSTQPEARSAKDQLHELELKGRKIRVGYVNTPHRDQAPWHAPMLRKLTPNAPTFA